MRGDTVTRTVKRSVQRIATSSALMLLAAIVMMPNANAFDIFLLRFNTLYFVNRTENKSESGRNAGCQLCHRVADKTSVSSTQARVFTPYGAAYETSQNLFDNDWGFLTLENRPSINASLETTNLQEINASTQPGWGAGDASYTGDGLLDPLFCDFSLTESTLDFATVDVGESKTLTVTITNDGTAACTITPDLALDPGTNTGEFSLEPAGTFTVAADGGIADVSVTYTPKDDEPAGGDGGTLTLATSPDSLNPQTETVDLKATGFQPVCDFIAEPKAIDYGQIEVGISSRLYTTVKNNGTADCSITASIDSSSSEFALASEGPFTVEVGQTADVFVDYTPAAPVDVSTPDTATLSLDSDDPHNPDTNELVTLEGTGIIRPVVDVESPIIVDATGYVTHVPLAQDADAEDKDGNALTPVVDEIVPPVPDPNAALYRPGRYTITYIATDGDEIPGAATQELIVKPLVSLGGAQVTGEGQTVTVPVRVNGKAHPDPVIIDYAVNGTADGADHDLVSGSVEVTTGNQTTSAQLEIQIADDDIEEADEDIVITLTGVSDNAVLSDNTVHTVVITERNIEPAVSLVIAQSGVSGPYVYQGLGPAEVAADAVDPNGDLLSFDWSHSDPALGGTATDGRLDVDIDSLAAGAYAVVVLVSDGVNRVTHTATLVVGLAEDAPTLGDGNTDGDGDIDGDGMIDTDADEGRADGDHDGLPDYLDAVDDTALQHLRIEEDGENRTRLIRAEAGLSLVLGSHAVVAKRNGVRISTLDVPVDDEFSIVGGVYDFEIHGLSEAQRVARVVIPLEQSIPVNATYRKYSQAWYSFIEDATDGIRSASSTDGECPPPGSDDYQPGLVAFTDCVELTMADGGANDADGEANGVIKDPGGVAVPAEVSAAPSSAPDSSPGGGSGALDLWWLMLLLPLFWSCRRHY